MTHSAENGLPKVGDLYRWSGDPSLTIEVVKVGRKNATIKVTGAPGSSWVKPQPMPFPDSFTRVTPKDAPTNWPICTRHVGRDGGGHVGNEDYGPASPAWEYVDKHGNATCSCCDPANGFPCVLPPGGMRP